MGLSLFGGMYRVCRLEARNSYGGVSWALKEEQAKNADLEGIIRAQKNELREAGRRSTALAKCVQDLQAGLRALKASSAEGAAQVCIKVFHWWTGGRGERAVLWNFSAGLLMCGLGIRCETLVCTSRFFSHWPKQHPRTCSNRDGLTHTWGLNARTCNAGSITARPDTRLPCPSLPYLARGLPTSGVVPTPRACPPTGLAACSEGSPMAGTLSIWPKSTSHVPLGRSPPQPPHGRPCDSPAGYIPRRG
jgi:hypothetical protein